MDKNREKQIKELQKEMEKLPLEMKKAMHWAIHHWKLVEWLCKDTELTDMEMEEMKKKAIEKNDYILGLLLCAVQVFNKDDETERKI